jgi:RHS repeat-associated protein
LRDALHCRLVIALILLAVWSSDATARLIPITHCLRGIVNGDRANSTLQCWTDYEDDGEGAGGLPFGGERGSGERGGVNHDNRGDHDSVTDASNGDALCDKGANPVSGNPIVLATGDKVEPELDFASSGEMPLTLKRTYNHFWKYVGLFGKHWTSSFDYSLVWQNSDAVIFAQRPDGRRIKFARVGATNRWNENKPTPVAYIVKNADGTYTHYTEANGVETYDGGGKPLKIGNAHGIAWTYNYASDYPRKITHTSGRYVQLGWTAGQLTAVTDPAGAVHTFAYTANAFGSGKHRLASTTRPGATGDPATTTAYYYEDARYPGGLTGKAYNGVRYSKFAYDDQARAISSEHATGGIDRFTYAYTGTPVVPPTPPPDPPTPGSHCNPTTHSCPAPPVIGGANDAELAANTALAAAEDDVIAHADATTSVLETNPLGLKTTYTFADGQLTSASGQAAAYCAARSRSRAYDANGNENLVTDFNGNKTQLTYNAKGQLSQKIEAYGTALARTTTYAWDTTYNRLISETVAGDRQTSYAYTADQRLAGVTIKNLAPNGVLNQTHAWTFTYAKYASGLVQSMVADGPQAGSGDKITYSYATTGDLVSVGNTHGHATTYSLYDGAGRPGRVVGPNGDQTDLAYYSDGHLKQVTTYPNNVAATTSFTYAAGLVATSKTPDNVTTSYAYDAARRLIDESRPELNGTADRKIFYDLASHPTRAEIYRGATLRYRAYTDYDEAGRVRGRRGNSGENVRYGYDKNDNVLTLTDSLNRVTHFAYDALDRLTQETDAKNGITKYDYDKGDRVSKITDPKSLATTYAYDGFGQLWKEASPDRGTTTYGYTASGFRNVMTRANALAESYGYDDIGRLISIAAGGKAETFAYDTCAYGKGRVCTLVDPSGTQSYTYTKEGLVASQQTAYAPAHGGSSSISYAYDAMGRPLTITNTSAAAQQQQQFTYASGQLSAVKVKIGAAAAVNVATAFTYEPMGPVTGFTYGNGLARTKTYDLDRRLTAIAETGASAIQSLAFVYNANDAITTLTNNVNATLSQTFGYDELARLTSVTSTSGNEAFTYDANGNRLTHTTSAGLATLSYLPGTNRLGSWTRSGSATRSYGYDAAGNTIALLGKTYTYGPYNRLINVSGGGSTATYDVNALGERVYKNRDGVETFFLYTPDHTLFGEYTRGGTGWNDYVRVGGEPIAMVRNGVVYYLHDDQLGRPEAVTNAAKAVVWRAKNFAFDRSVATDSFGGLNIGFAGQYYDLETDSFYNVSRDYDRIVGRYRQTDPLGLTAGVNPYTYVGNSPVIWSDPTGRNAVLTTELGAEGGFVACGPVCAVLGGAIGLGLGVWGMTEAINHLSEAQDGSESKPSNCPSGTLPIDQAKGKFGLSHQDAEDIKVGVIAGPQTWTGIAPNGDVWVGTPDGKGRNEGRFSSYLPRG